MVELNIIYFYLFISSLILLFKSITIKNAILTSGFIIEFFKLFFMVYLNILFVDVYCSFLILRFMDGCVFGGKPSIYIMSHLIKSSKSRLCIFLNLFRLFSPKADLFFAFGDGCIRLGAHLRGQHGSCFGHFEQLFKACYLFVNCLALWLITIIFTWRMLFFYKRRRTNSSKLLTV